MKTNHQEKPPHLTVSEFEVAAIKQRADRVGKQIGEAVSSFLAEIMISILATRPQASSTRSQSASPRSESILTASEVADILRISKAKAYRMMQQGEIPAIQFDRTTRVRRQDLNEFITACMK